MEEKEIIPYNTPEDGVAPTITTMYARLGTNNLTPGEYGGAMGIMEVKSYASSQRGDGHKIETRKDEVQEPVIIADPYSAFGEIRENKDVSPTLRARDYKSPHLVAEPLKIPQATKQGYIECPIGGVFDASYPDSDKRRGRAQDNGEVSPTLTTNSEGALLRYEGVEPNPLLQKGAVIANTQLNCYRGTIDEPAPTVCAAGGMGGGHVAMVVENVEPQVLTPLRTEEGRQLRKQGIEKFSNRALYPREDGCSNTITSVTKDNYLQEPKIVGYTRDSKGNIVNNHLQDHANTIHTCTGSGRNTDQYVAEAAQELKEIAQGGRSCDVDVTINEDGSLRPYNKNTKAKDGISEFVTQYEDNSANTVTTSHSGNVYGKSTRYRIRKLTEREVFRLMDVSEDDIDKIQAAGISKTAQYKLAGNSIVVSCLYHIFRKMFVEPECEGQQLSLF